jgi:polyvinyl alcohol dehydrogenase (cytochrome)
MRGTGLSERSAAVAVVAAGCVIHVALAGAQAPPAVQDMDHPQGTNAGIFAFTGACSTCHDTGKDGAPDRYALNARTPEEVLAKISTGPHAVHAQQLSEFTRRVIAVYVGGRPLGAAATGDKSAMKGACTTTPAFMPLSGSEWNGWGMDLANTRYQPSPGLAAADVPKLQLEWAFGFPMGNSAYGQPAVVGGRVFVGADTGFVYSLDAGSGCLYWSFRANAGVRTAPTVGAGSGGHRFLVYFGDIRANVYAVDAETGVLVWSARLDAHPIARVTGAPKLADGKLFVPLSSLEESGAGNPVYPCCTFRGGVAAYDARTGRRLWKSFSVAREPVRRKVTSKGTQLWAPAGAGVWSSPTVDLERRAVYVATGNGYTEPADEGSDAVIAFDLDTGRRLWAKQVMEADHYIRDCPGIYRPNVPKDNKSETCPDDLGPDYDFGNAPILGRLASGRRVIVIGQKSGHAWALDPAKKGEVLWSRQLGLGFENGGGGMMWGSAADPRFAYFPLTRTDARLGLAALSLATGEIAWRATPPEGGGAPVTVMPDVVFFGAGNGVLFAYSAENGRAIWQYNTARAFDTVNGVEARGGNINAAGPVVAGGRVFVTSGYSDLGGGVRGNVLLAFAAR